MTACLRHWHLKFPWATAEKRNVFRALHECGCFVIPNPWNVGTARYLQGLGFKALATTSSGFAHSQGYADERNRAIKLLAHFRRDRRSRRRAGQRRLRRRLCRRSRPLGRKRDALHRDRRRRPVDRGFDRRSRPAAVRFRLALARVRPRARRSTRPAVTSCSLRAPRASSVAGRTWTRPSAG